MNAQHDDGNWRETHFTTRQWARVPATAGLWYRSEPNPAADDRLRTAEEIAFVLYVIALSTEI